jgi:F1F0 ATPase subunit 2
MHLNDIQWYFGGLWGMVLGFFYFGGLWLTVSQIPKTPHPEKLLLISFIARLGLTMAGLWIVMVIHHGAFFAALVTFFVIRWFMIKHLKPVRPKAETRKKTCASRPIH